MYTKITYSLVAALLIACSPGDMSEPVKATRPMEPKVTLQVHFAPQDLTIRKCNEIHAWPDAISESMTKTGSEAIGCAAMNIDTKVCDVYVPNITSTGQTDRFATLGHETLHCFIGKYHS